jgi:hypothetical protein
MIWGGFLCVVAMHCSAYISYIAKKAHSPLQQFVSCFPLRSKFELPVVFWSTKSDSALFPGILAPGIYCEGSTIFINHEARRWRLRLTVWPSILAPTKG